MELLHIHGQEVQHDAVHIVGNEEALEALGNAIEVALQAGRGAYEPFTADGEGYTLYVHHVEEPFEEASTKWALPYTELTAYETRDHVVHPWERILLSGEGDV